MRRAARRPRPTSLLVAGGAGFAAGVLLTAAMFALSASGERHARDDAASTDVAVRPTLNEPPPVAPARARTDAMPAVAVDAVADRRRRNLLLPVAGINRDELRDTFNDPRGGGRRHEALDVLAPRHTPVVAVEDGTIARLFSSAAGGITIYQFDPRKEYVYYYAHLERYAADLEEEDRVTRGQVIGYVGTTGNAPRNSPHLHFAVFKMDGERKWWQGTAIDPYQIFR